MTISGPYFYPDEGPVDTGGSNVDLLNTVDKGTPDETSETPEAEETSEAEGAEEIGEGDEVDLLEGESDETDEEAKEGEEEGEESTEETDETGKETEQLVNGKVDLKKVKEKYPKLFKDFPGLREQFFKGVNYDRLFGSVDAAEIAQSKAENYDVLESSLR